MLGRARLGQYQRTPYNTLPWCRPQHPVENHNLKYQTMMRPVGPWRAGCACVVRSWHTKPNQTKPNQWYPLTGGCACVVRRATCVQIEIAIDGSSDRGSVLAKSKASTWWWWGWWWQSWENWMMIILYLPQLQLVTVSLVLPGSFGSVLSSEFFSWSVLN